MSMNIMLNKYFNSFYEKREIHYREENEKG